MYDIILNYTQFNMLYFLCGFIKNEDKSKLRRRDSEGKQTVAMPAEGMRSSV